MEYQNVKIVKSIFKCEKSNKNKRSNVTLKENKIKKDINDVCYMTFKFAYLFDAYVLVNIIAL